MDPENKGDWVRMFKEEYLVRVGYQFGELSDGDLFYEFYGYTPHQAVMQWINKYDLTDMTAGKTVYYVVVEADDGAYLVENNPGEDMVMWCGTDKFSAECQLCKCCN
jgi:hypothetical protein